MRKINIFVWCLWFKCLYNVSDSVKDGEAMIYQGLWGTWPFIRGGTAHLSGGRSPLGPIAGYGSADGPKFATGYCV